MLNITELTCRVCLEERDVLINIYDKLEELNTNLSNLLESCADLQIREEDIFPKYLCEDCTRELLIASKFREKCDKSKELLFELLQNSKQMGNKELSNFSDFIEYCIEETEDIIIKEQSVDKEKDTEVPHEEIENVEQNLILSLSENHIVEPIKDFESQINENVLEEISLSEDKFIQLETDANPEEPAEADIIPVTVSWEEKASVILTKPLSVKSRTNHTFKCDLCGAIFKQSMNLRKHFEKTHDTVKYYVCSKCEHCFSLEVEFLKHVDNCTHLKTNTEGNETKKPKKEQVILDAALNPDYNRKCFYCDRDFPTPFALRMHLRTHTGERPFQCKYCTKSFKTQSQLNVHHKRHTGQADFICTVCNKTFYELSNLTVHMRSHTGERPHTCTICKKTFTRVFLLHIHMRTHTGEKPFNCTYCDKSFRQHTDLKSHLTIHTGQKRHNCSFCEKSYTKRSHLLQHMRKHPIESNSAETAKEVNFENALQQTETNLATNNIQGYVQNLDILSTFDGIIESDDIVIDTRNIA